MVYAHEQTVVVTGARSGLPIMAAVHSTARGPALGGCRLWRYPDWRDALEDVLRLSEAMTLKAALADLPVGGGKAVIALGPDDALPADRRRAALLDLGDLVQDLDGRFGVGEDVGITAEDLLVVRERTSWAYCLPEAVGGTGDPSSATARGVAACLDVLADRCFGAPTLAGRRVAVVGLGQVGGRLAARLAEQGAELVVSDLDPVKRVLADRLGAVWVGPEDAYRTSCDVLVPSALGGVIDAATVRDLDARAVCGPANNQLAGAGTADELAAAGIVWAPDFLVNAGGLIHGVTTELLGGTAAEVADRVDGLGGTLTTVLDIAEREGVTPLAAAERIAADRLTGVAA